MISRMPQYYVTNDGMGPYAIFSCDRCDREYRSQPNIKNTVRNEVAKGAFGGLLRNVPLVGDTVADNMENDRYRTDMSVEELEQAWGQVKDYFRECPTCHQIVCVPDFDEVSGFCDEDSPRRMEIEQAKAQQAAGFMKGIADAFGVTGALQKAAQAASQAAVCPSCGTASAAGTKFCPSCGTSIPQAAVGVTCSSCGSAVPAGQKFCGSCGTPVASAAPQETTCPSCGTTTSSAFCGNCGAKVR